MPSIPTEDLDYQVPESLIAQEPVTPRDRSRLLVVHRDSETLEHTIFSDIGRFLFSGDVLVINNSKVIPARLHLDDGRILLLLRRSESLWQVLSEKGAFRVGDRFEVKGLHGEVTSYHSTPGPKGESILMVDIHNEEKLEEVGETPLPPYIHSYKGGGDRYQTVYARPEGSAAAPTAGLHFTPELIESLKMNGIAFAEVTLHVSVDTFLPIKENDAVEHKIYSEYIQVSPDAAEIIKNSRRIICVGTTSVRTVEQMWAWRQNISSCEGFANIYITPGHCFHIDGMVTNFHYPRSTNLLLVTSFMSKDLLREVYKTAIDMRYRFFSFGDAMLIL